METRLFATAARAGSDSMHSMAPRLLVVAIALLAMPVSRAALTLAYEAPDFLDGPIVANSMFGTTYAYRARSIHDPTALQITVVKLPKSALAAGEFSSEHCVKLFLTEVAREKSNFFAVPVEAALAAGELQLQQVRWTRKDAGVGMTGVTSCGLIHDSYVSINFQDSLARAATTFPTIRKSLTVLDIRQ